MELYGILMLGGKGKRYNPSVHSSWLCGAHY